MMEISKLNNMVNLNMSLEHFFELEEMLTEISNLQASDLLGVQRTVWSALKTSKEMEQSSILNVTEFMSETLVTLAKHVTFVDNLNIQILNFQEDNFK